MEGQDMKLESVDGLHPPPPLFSFNESLMKPKETMQLKY
jgi:hypothetical protein